MKPQRENSGSAVYRSLFFFKEHPLEQDGGAAGIPLPAWLHSWRAPLLVAIAYYLGAESAFLIGTLSDRIFAPFWPPNIVLFCALLLVPSRQWWMYIAVAFPAHVIAETTVGMPAAQSLMAFATNCIVAILNAYGVRRFLKGPPWLGSLRNAAIYVLITAAVSPAIAALGGAFVQIFGGEPIANYWTYWANWDLANALGSVTLGPMFLIWFGLRAEGERFTLHRKLEAIVLATGLVTVCAIVFDVGTGTISTRFVPALFYSPLPLILWAAIRFGERGATGTILLVTLVSIWRSLHQSTLFIGNNPGSSVLALQIFLLGIAIPVLLLGSAIDDLRRSGDAMRTLAGSLLRAQDEERRRIARELHDSTGQNLIMANLMATRIESAAPQSSQPAIAELKDFLQAAMTEIRTVSYLLHPPLFDAGGLSISLRSYLGGFSERTGISVDLDIPPNLQPMPSDIELVLFRIIQEALTNVWRHSGSKTARIRLIRDIVDGQPRVMLSVEDEGKGIPNKIRTSVLSKSNRTPTGLGLVSMRERLHQIGGQLEIESMSGKTVIRATVPLNDEAEA